MHKRASFFNLYLFSITSLSSHHHFIVPSDFFHLLPILSNPFFLLAMSKRSASDPPQDRPSKQHVSNGYQATASPTPGHEVCPHEGCPHHAHSVTTTSNPLQTLTNAPTHGSPVQAPQGHHLEYPWSLVQEPPILNFPVSTITRFCSMYIEVEAHYFVRPSIDHVVCRRLGLHGFVSPSLCRLKYIHRIH